MEEDLNDVWTYYFHDPNNEDWNLNSYLRLHDISTIKDFWQIENTVKDKLKNGMFFIMRSDCFPCWDDETNINGGCLSIKVLKDNLVDYWQNLSVRLLGETLFKDEYSENWNVINGISTSPKRYFCVVKIWLKNNDFNDKKYFRLPENFYGDIIYRANIENIQKTH